MENIVHPVEQHLYPRMPVTAARIADFQALPRTKVIFAGHFPIRTNDQKGLPNSDLVSCSLYERHTRVAQIVIDLATHEINLFAHPDNIDSTHTVIPRASNMEEADRIIAGFVSDTITEHAASLAAHRSSPRLTILNPAFVIR